MKKASMRIQVQTQDFDGGAELAKLRADNASVGAVVSFIGLVREFSENTWVHTLMLEHYPGMTERVLYDMGVRTRERWGLLDLCVIHRVGSLRPTEQIVFVGVASAHRAHAFEACAFIVDQLKTSAPFWKKEMRSDGIHWVRPTDADEQRAALWHSES